MSSPAEFDPESPEPLESALPERLQALQRACHAHGAQLVAVTKHATAAQIRQLHSLGARDVGENRVQDALAKMEALGPDITQSLRWHLIGSLQRNKVAKTVGRFHLIHSVDSLPLAEKISQVNAAQGLVQPILLQANLSGEPQKGGFSPEALMDSIARLQALPGVSLRGLMTMTPQGAGASGACQIFTKLYEMRNALQAAWRRSPGHLSMGMSQDYIHALRCGATIVRVGSVLFGSQTPPRP